MTLVSHTSCSAISAGTDATGNAGSLWDFGTEVSLTFEFIRKKMVMMTSATTCCKSNRDSFDMETFVNDTSLHGVKKACTRDFSAVRRLVWVVLMLALFLGLVFILRRNVLDYLR